MKTLALVNNKDRVGKTTSAINPAGGLADEGRRVLLTDLDARVSLIALHHLTARPASRKPLLS